MADVEVQTTIETAHIVVDEPATEQHKPAQVADAKPKKTKAKKPAAPKKPSAHPPFFAMVSDAISTLKEKTGSSQYAIAKFAEDKHKQLPPNFRKLLLVQLRRFVASGKLVKVKNSYKLAAAKAPVKKAASGTTKPKKTATKKKPATAKPSGKAKSVTKPKSKAKTAVAKPKTAAKAKPAAKPKPAAKAKPAAAAAKAKAKPSARPAKAAKTSATATPGKKAPVAAKKATKKAAPAKKIGTPAKSKVAKKPKTVKSAGRRASSRTAK